MITVYFRENKSDNMWKRKNEKKKSTSDVEEKDVYSWEKTKDSKLTLVMMSQMIFLHFRQILR